METIKAWTSDDLTKELQNGRPCMVNGSGRCLKTNCNDGTMFGRRGESSWQIERTPGPNDKILNSTGLCCGAIDMHRIPNIEAEVGGVRDGG